MPIYTESQITIDEIAYHRNGMGGEGFYVVSFTYYAEFSEPGEDTDSDRKMVAVVFADNNQSWSPDSRSDPRTAVFDRAKLGDGIIAFGSNSFRGDNFDDVLRRAIIKHEEDS